MQCEGALSVDLNEPILDRLDDIWPVEMHIWMGEQLATSKILRPKGIRDIDQCVALVELILGARARILAILAGATWRPDVVLLAGRATLDVRVNLDDHEDVRA